MNRPPGVDSGESTTVDTLARIDAVCDRFESAWAGGGEPDLAAYLGAATGPFRARLYRELLALELEYRRRRGEAPVPAAYGARFPDDQAVTDAVFAPSGPPRAAFAAAPSGRRDLPTRSGLADRVTPHRAWKEAAGRSPAVLDALEAAGYEVLGELGRGGMGVVYLARKRALNRLCGLKMILAGAHAGPSVAARFRLEAEAVARLRHP